MPRPVPPLANAQRREGLFASSDCIPFHLLRNAPSVGRRTLCLLPETFIIERQGRLPVSIIAKPPGHTGRGGDHAIPQR